MACSPEQIVAIDVDRTLINTDIALDRLIDVSDQMGLLSRNAFMDVRAQVQASGGSFDVDSFIRKAGIDDEARYGLYDTFVSETDPNDLLYPEVPDFLNALESMRLQAMLMTMGAVDWQLPKIKAGGMDKYPHIITDEKDKGFLIQRYKDHDGYNLPSMNLGKFVAKSVCLIDDKADSFRGLPGDCSGFLVRRSETVLPSQAGTIPANVLTVRGLEQILPYLSK